MQLPHYVNLITNMKKMSHEMSVCRYVFKHLYNVLDLMLEKIYAVTSLYKFNDKYEYYK